LAFAAAVILSCGFNKEIEMPTENTGPILEVVAGATPEAATPLAIGVCLISHGEGGAPQYVRLPEKAAIGAVVEAYFTGHTGVVILPAAEETWLNADQAVQFGSLGGIFARKMTETQWGVMVSRNP
jgi:hypothetical protein